MEALAVAALAARPLLAPTPLAAALDAAAAKLRAGWLADVFSFEPDTDAALWSFDGAAGGQSPDADADLFRDLLDRRPRRRTRSAPTTTPPRAPRWRPAAASPRSASSCAAGPGSSPPPTSTRAGRTAPARQGLRPRRLPPRSSGSTDEHVPPPDGFDLALYARDRFGALDGEVEEVRLLVEAEAVPAFKRKLYNPTQQIEEEREDGRAVVSFEAGGMDAVKAWCLSWGPKVRRAGAGVAGGAGRRGTPQSRYPVRVMSKENALRVRLRGAATTPRSPSYAYEGRLSSGRHQGQNMGGSLGNASGVDEGPGDKPDPFCGHSLCLCQQMEMPPYDGWARLVDDSCASNVAPIEKVQEDLTAVGRAVHCRAGTPERLDKGNSVLIHTIQYHISGLRQKRYE